MKAARERAEFWLAMNVAGYSEKQIDCLEVLLKEQDVITRHTCADAVLNTPLRGPYYDDGHISKNETHHRVINVKAV